MRCPGPGRRSKERAAFRRRHNVSGNWEFDFGLGLLLVNSITETWPPMGEHACPRAGSSDATPTLLQLLTAGTGTSLPTCLVIAKQQP